MKLPPPDSALGAMMAQFPRHGRVEWIGVRPGRELPVRELDQARVLVGQGLDGDRYRGGSGKRAVTLIQAEHLPVIAVLLGRDAAIEPAILRRNVVVSGVPLIALKGQRFRIGGALLEGTSPCDPCSKMEAALGAGAFNAMRGHGGLCARVIEEGSFRVGDPVVALTGHQAA